MKKNNKALTTVEVNSYKHKDSRVNIPTQELSYMLRDSKVPPKKTYKYDPSLDPQLIWSGKEEKEELNVDTVPIYIQEKISPEAIIAKLRSDEANSTGDYQMSMFFEAPEQTFDKMVSFYHHEDNWRNRFVLGDSLLVMNSLLEKEGMAGKVQCVYIDPPYGIKYGSNWQVSTKQRDVKDGRDDQMVRQPEQIKAFRDTWELGVHSYLSYLRDRLITARELLNETGSCFLQISDENLHLVRNLLDEVFGTENFVTQITFRTKIPLNSEFVPNIADYILWYAKDKPKLKFRRYFEKREFAGDSQFNWIRTPNGEDRKLTPEERSNTKLIPTNAKIFRLTDLIASGHTDSCHFEFELDGKKYYPKGRNSWKTTPHGMQKLISMNRIKVQGSTPAYVFFYDDYPIQQVTNIWEDTQGATGKTYVVQTAEKVIQRCILMCTDPGDLVLDPTCGSGTTAYVCENWGRRWITIDTSRVALSLAKTRLMTSKYPYFQLKTDGKIKQGFKYKTAPHITLGSIANNEPAEEETLYDQPLEDKSRVRVSGPFTVENLSPHQINAETQQMTSENFEQTVIDNLLKSGVQNGIKNERLVFENLEIRGGSEFIHADGEYREAEQIKRVAVAIGPEYGSVDDDFVRGAVKEAGRYFDTLVILATSFDGSAHAENEVPAFVGNLNVVKVKINPDLSMGDLLKKTGSANLFIAFGEPDIEVTNLDEKMIQVKVNGIDVFDPTTGQIRSGGKDDIASWFIDTNYNGESFFVHHAYFLGAQDPYEKLRKALKADINEEIWDQLYSDTSLAFHKPKTGKIAIKVINHFGDEVMKVISV